jgi:hypothetical protein
MLFSLKFERNRLSGSKMVKNCPKTVKIVANCKNSHLIGPVGHGNLRNIAVKLFIIFEPCLVNVFSHSFENIWALGQIFMIANVQPLSLYEASSYEDTHLQPLSSYEDGNVYM